MENKYPHLVTKREYTKYIGNRLGNRIKVTHIRSVVSILLDEMLKDFLEGKTVDIHNFGEFYVKPTKSWKIFDFVNKKHIMKKPYKYLKFFVLKKIKIKIMKFIDIDKIFGDD